MSFLESPKGQQVFDAYLGQFSGKSSQKVYRSEIRQFFTFFSGGIRHLSRGTFDAYREHLAKQGKSEKTVKRKFSMVSSFLRFVEKETPGFVSPIGRTYGDLTNFQVADYANSETYKAALARFRDTLVSENTKGVYEQNVNAFFRWSGKKPDELTQKDFLRYRDHMRKNLKTSTVWNRFIALNRFLKFLATERRNFKNPLNFRGLNIALPPKDTGYYAVLSEKELTHLLSQPDRSCMGKRDHAILRLLATYGLRVNEITKLRFRDLDRERVGGQQKLWIRDRKGRLGKRKTTAIILNGKSLDALDAWTEASAWDFEPDTPLFLPFRWDRYQHCLMLNHARAREGSPLTVRAIQKIVRKHVRSARFEAGERVVSGHCLRHSAFTLLAKHGVRLIDLQYLAAHNDISTTLIYVHSVQSYEDHAGLKNPLNF